jgi:hypothetical protein
MEGLDSGNCWRVIEVNKPNKSDGGGGDDDDYDDEEEGKGEELIILVHNYQ